ncbi:hypothetical protein F5Y02DRAFT_8201 [Annulohypoxylon stygium]|nr:hypothetical protein F5Y02DRAFT_8201 [Annulohypoxylon stygium]
MKHIHGGNQDCGDENINQDGDQEPQRGRGSTRSNKLSAPLRLPKNRSTGNLAVVAEFPERPRLRFSFDTGSGVTESDQITRDNIPTYVHHPFSSVTWIYAQPLHCTHRNSRPPTPFDALQRMPRKVQKRREEKKKKRETFRNPQVYTYIKSE